MSLLERCREDYRVGFLPPRLGLDLPMRLFATEPLLLDLPA